MVTINWNRISINMMAKRRPYTEIHKFTVIVFDRMKVGNEWNCKMILLTFRFSFSFPLKKNFPGTEKKKTEN